jgi:hypothetical protein
MRSRIASTIIAGLLLLRPGLSAHATVTGLSFEPKSPIVGHSMSVIAIDDQKHTVVKWDWTYTFTDAEANSRPTMIESTVPGRATLDLHYGGTYKVALEVTYGGPMPPPSETMSVALSVARPEALKNIDGLDVLLPYPDTAIATTIRYQVMSRGTEAGVHLSGLAQRRVRNRTRWDGKKEPDQAWEPDAPGNMLFQRGGVIESLVILNIDPRDWAKVPDGKPIVTWDEDVRLIYGIETSRGEAEGMFNGQYKLVNIACCLGNEHLSIVKVDNGHWAVRRGVAARSSKGR